MSHPWSRAERRHQRDRIVARRRKTAEVMWGYNNGAWLARGWELYTTWGIYAKWNGNCGCTMCHGAKYLSCKRRRRASLNMAFSQAEFRKRDKVVGKH
jgi:hypothetical protein